MLLCILCDNDYVLWQISSVVTEKSRTNWHLINVRPPSTQQYVMKYVKKGSRVFVGGRIEYLRSQDEQGETKDLAVIISGMCQEICFTLKHVV